MLRQSVSCGGATSSLEDEDQLSVKRHRRTIFGQVWGFFNPPPVIDLGGPSRLAENRPSFMLTGGPSRIDLQRSLACTLAALNIARRSVGEHNPRYAELLLELATLTLDSSVPKTSVPRIGKEGFSTFGNLSEKRSPFPVSCRKRQDPSRLVGGRCVPSSAFAACSRCFWSSRAAETLQPAKNITQRRCLQAEARAVCCNM
jgi:hypothetical protein